jgi:hypothetical protein
VTSQNLQALFCQHKKECEAMKKTIPGILLSLFVVASAFSQQFTNNNADQTLRGSSRVNPSTLGMEISIPLVSFPGRGISIPVNLSYSSKVWRLQYIRTDPAVNSPSCQTINLPKYAETTASGWTSSLGFAYIEYTGKAQIFDSRGVAQGDAAPTCESAPDDNLDVYVRRLILHMPSGETHELRADDTPVLFSAFSNCPNSPCDQLAPIGLEKAKFSLLGRFMVQALNGYQEGKSVSRESKSNRLIELLDESFNSDLNPWISKEEAETSKFEVGERKSISVLSAVDIYSRRARRNEQRGKPIKGFECLMDNLSRTKIKTILVYGMIDDRGLRYMIFTDPEISEIIGLLRFPY